MHPRRFAAGFALAVLALVLSVAPAHAQGTGKDKHYAVSNDRAVTVTRNMLVRQGYNVVRIERVGTHPARDHGGHRRQPEAVAEPDSGRKRHAFGRRRFPVAFRRAAPRARSTHGSTAVRSSRTSAGSS